MVGDCASNHAHSGGSYGCRGVVPLIGEKRFFKPVLCDVARYVFPPLANSYRILPASLGEEVVVHGADALAVTSEG